MPGGTDTAAARIDPLFVNAQCDAVGAVGHVGGAASDVSR
jgi:hypothetical protein